MKKKNHIQIEEELEKKAKKRARKKKPKVKVSGKSVFGLREIIRRKAKKK